MKIFLMDEIGYYSPKQNAMRDREIESLLAAGRDGGKSPYPERDINVERDHDAMKVHKVELATDIPAVGTRSHPKTKKYAARVKKAADKARELSRALMFDALGLSKENGDYISGLDMLCEDDGKRAIKDELRSISIWLQIAALDYKIMRSGMPSCAKALVVHDSSGTQGRPIDRKYFNRTIRALAARLVSDENIKALSARFDAKAKLLHVYEHPDADYAAIEGHIVRAK